MPNKRRPPESEEQREKRIEGQLVARSRQVLRSQANLLCNALESLRRHTEAGLETAGEIWDSLLNGILAEISPDFFEEYAQYYFWQSGEVLTTDELAFRRLLEQAQVKQQKMEEKEQEGGREEIKKEIKEKEEVEDGASGEQCQGPSTMMAVAGSSATCCEGGATKDEEQEENEEIDRLLANLLGMLKVAAEKTHPAIWEWKEDDKELKKDVERFHGELKVAVTLFTQVHDKADVNKVIEAVELFSSTEAAKMLQIVNSNEPVSSDVSECEYGEEEESEEESSDESTGDEDSSSEPGTCPNCHRRNSGSSSEEETDPASKPLETTGQEKEGNKDGEKKEEDKEGKSDDKKDRKGEGVKEAIETFKAKNPPRKTDSVTRMEDLSDADSEGYIVRHTKYLKKKPTSGVKCFQNPDCDHSGYIGYITHFRDWKRDGFRCMCGLKFRFLNAMDKHIYAQQEARMLTCEICGYKVGRNCCMDTHKRDYHEKPKMLRSCRRMYQCTYGCEVVMKTKKQLFDHQKRTDRQCLHNNTLKVAMKLLPTSSEGFMRALNLTCERAGISLTLGHLHEILEAAEKDADRMSKLLKESEEDSDVTDSSQEMESDEMGGSCE